MKLTRSSLLLAGLAASTLSFPVHAHDPAKPERAAAAKTAAKKTGTAATSAKPATTTGDAPAPSPTAAGTARPASILEEVVIRPEPGAPTPAASAGTASGETMRARPVLRRGEILEVVPGMIVTQHAGTGKANQYFLRGYNLDHGTDFATSLEGLPLNLRTHAHGQGYTDLHGLIPEAVERVDYVKGTYTARNGDLSTAGSADFRLYDVLPRNFATFELGEHNYYRAVAGHTITLGAPDPKGTTPHSHLTIMGEYHYYDGPWVLPEQGQRINGMVRWFSGDEDNHVALTFLGYHGIWQSTDQIPQRAINSGRLDRFGNADPSNGGNSQRYSGQFEWQQRDAEQTTRVQVYAAYYDLDLFSNFTYALDNPVRGDQFEQVESRWILGGEVLHRWEKLTVFGHETAIEAGLQTRTDLIDGIGLHKTDRRERFDTVREDDVMETSAGLYADVNTKWTPWLRTSLGLRADVFYFDVHGEPANSGSDWDGIVSPKFSAIFGPWKSTELYVNFGTGFHSNDARGVLNTRDPQTGDPLDPVDPLVRTFGGEIGARTKLAGNFTGTLAAWWIESDSELVYIGDAGTNEAGPGSRRYGVEATLAWKPKIWLTLDAEVALTKARFTESPGADRIPDSVPWMANAGVTLGEERGLYGTLRARAFGRRPLIEDNSVKGRETFTMNAVVGYRTDRWEAAVECLNLLDREDNDIEYFYTSRLPGEDLAGFDDIHVHPAEPRMFRARFTVKW